MFRRSRRPEPDPYDPTSLGEAYRAPANDALRARQQYQQLVETVRPGPLRERLEAMSPRVDAGVAAVWETARKATELERVVATLDPDRVTAELKHARRANADPEVVDALSARFASVQRLMNSLDTLRGRLPILESRLGTAIARAAELALTSSSTELPALESELSGAVIELEALARATAELA